MKTLTERQETALSLAAAGFTQEEMAGEMGISVSRVRQLMARVRVLLDIGPGQRLLQQAARTYFARD